MSHNLKEVKKILNTDPSIFWRFFVVFAVFILITVFTIKFHISSPISAYTKVDINELSLESKGNLTFPEPNIVSADKAVADKLADIEKKALEEKMRIEREAKINRVLNFLYKYKSQVAKYEYAAQIVDLSAENNADFRVLVAIMGLESGFCRIHIYHNCFGYLNRVKYSSFQSAFADLVPKVSRQYVAKYGTNYLGLAKAYGAHNYEYWAANLKNWVDKI